MKEKIINKEIKFIEEEGSYLLGVSSPNGNYILAREITTANKEQFQSNNMEYYNSLIVKGNLYEAIEVKNLANQTIAQNIFQLVKNINKSLILSIKEIEEIVKNIYDNISIYEIRGLFGELSALANDSSLRPNLDPNSIYDFIDENENDLEIKTFSKIKRSITVSFQQLTNNPNATIHCIEVYESSAGMSIVDLYKNNQQIHSERYNFLLNAKNPLLEKKFLVGSIKRLIAGKIWNNSKLPDSAVDAKFIIKVD